MDSLKRKRPPNFRLEIPGDENLKNRILEKFQEVKRYLTTSLDKPVNNANIIKELLDVWKNIAMKISPVMRSMLFHQRMRKWQKRM
jgi:hypothetical protein